MCIIAEYRQTLTLRVRHISQARLTGAEIGAGPASEEDMELARFLRGYGESWMEEKYINLRTDQIKPSFAQKWGVLFEWRWS